MQIQAKYGAQQLSTGGTGPLRLDSDGALVTRNVCGKYREAAIAGRLFSVANQATVSTTAALATTWTGLGVCNPAGSGKNLIIHEVGWAVVAQVAAEMALGLMISDDTGFASALTSRPAMYGAGSSVAYCDDGATIATPILYRIVASLGDGDPNVGSTVPPTIIDLGGSIVLPPDRSIMTYTGGATTSDLIFHFMWEEVNA